MGLVRYPGWCGSVLVQSAFVLWLRLFGGAPLSLLLLCRVWWPGWVGLWLWVRGRLRFLGWSGSVLGSFCIGPPLSFGGYSRVFLLALLTIEAMALWQREGMSTRSGVSLVSSILASCVGVGLGSNRW